MSLPFDSPGTGPPSAGPANATHPTVSPCPPAGQLQPGVHFVRHPRARRYVLRVQTDGSVRVTIPRAGTRREGEAFLNRSRAWVERQRSALRDCPAAGPLDDGDTVLVDGVRTRIAVARTGPHVTVTAGPLVATGRSQTDVRDLVVRALRAHAARELPLRVLALASDHALAPGPVTVRDQKGRWGSCSATGRISLNWRLVQMPPQVRDYVLLHELMHLREPNHSRRFWRHVARACPWHMEARRWLSHAARTLL